MSNVLSPVPNISGCRRLRLEFAARLSRRVAALVDCCVERGARVFNNLAYAFVQFGRARLPLRRHVAHLAAQIFGGIFGEITRFAHLSNDDIPRIFLRKQNGGGPADDSADKKADEESTSAFTVAHNKPTPSLGLVR